MLPECAWYCKDTYAANFRINLQIINNEMMILIYLICGYIMLHQFISSCKFKICVVYLRMLSRMKATYIYYFQYSFLEICIINMYVIIHGSENHGYSHRTIAQSVSIDSQDIARAISVGICIC